MRYIVYFFSALIALALVPAATFAATPFHQGEMIVLAANNALELDITMEMLDEDAESAADLINVIELPVQEMHREQVRNERRIRQDGEARPFRQELGSPDAVQADISNQIIEAQQEAEEAKRQAYDDMVQKKGR